MYEKKKKLIKKKKNLTSNLRTEWFNKIFGRDIVSAGRKLHTMFCVSRTTLLGSQWDSHKPPGFHLKFLKLCSEDQLSFYGFGTTWG